MWLKVAQEPSYDNLPLDMRVDNLYLQYPAACTPNVSVCTNTIGSHTCSCKSGYVLSGNDCVKAGTSGSYKEGTMDKACPAGAISKPGAKSKDECVCPAGHFRDASNKDLVNEDRPCIPCPAGRLGALVDHILESETPDGNVYKQLPCMHFEILLPSTLMTMVMIAITAKVDRSACLFGVVCSIRVKHARPIAGSWRFDLNARLQV